MNYIKQASRTKQKSAVNSVENEIVKELIKQQNYVKPKADPYEKFSIETVNKTDQKQKARIHQTDIYAVTEYEDENKFDWRKCKLYHTSCLPRQAYGPLLAPGGLHASIYIYIPALLLIALLTPK